MAKISIQQIMLGTVTGTEEAAASALARLRAAGYDQIELNNFQITPTPFVVRALTRAAGMPTGKGGKLDWARLVREAGLGVTSLHIDLGSLKNDPGAVAPRCHELGCGFAVVTGMYRFDYSDKEAVAGLARDLNECGEVLEAGGVSLLYHNHNCELLQVEPGVRAYDVLLDTCDERFVNFEFDSYWPSEAGADALAMMRSLGSRMRLWHIADRGTRASGPSMTPILKSDSVELGHGNIPLGALCEQALSAGVEAVVLESHRNWVDKSPLASAEASAEWLRTHLR
jgi:sugar phosphate isomerase/epimerase